MVPKEKIEQRRGLKQYLLATIVNRAVGTLGLAGLEATQHRLLNKIQLQVYDYHIFTLVIVF